MMARRSLHWGPPTLAIAGVVACGHPGRVAPALAACPVPRVDVRSWAAVDDSGQVRFRLPPEFTEAPPHDATREWHRGGDPQQYVIAGFITSSTPVAALGRVPSAGMMEMTSCVDSVDGREVLVQAWRTRGGVFRQGRRFDRYDVFAVLPVSPLRRFYLASGSYTRETQRLVLAAVRTLTLVPRGP